jgi:hypothetical protein
MLHVHPVVGSSTLGERQAADVYQQELASRAARHGFGFVDRKVQLRNPVAAAAYLSSYFVAGKKGKLTLRESVTTGSMPRSIVYVQPELSKRSGITMRSLRLKRHLWHRMSPTILDLLRDDFELSFEDIYRADQAGVKFIELMVNAWPLRGP